MAREEVVADPGGDWPFTNPRPFWQCGLAACGIAFVMYTLPIWIYSATGMNLGRFALVGGVWVFLRVLLLAVGILAAGGAVATKPKCPAVLGLAALAALLANWSMDPDWDSARLVMGLLVFIALFAAFLLLMPMLVGKLFAVWEFLFSGHREPDLQTADTRGRFAGWVLSRAILVVAVFLHFVGISSAIMSVPAPGHDTSWAFQNLFTLYQPYLQFFYLTNAYHFYSPEPGPPTLIWFRIEYADGSERWVKLPTREHDVKDPLAQEFTRRLSLGEAVNQVAPLPNVPDMVKQKRLAAGTFNDIPLHPSMPVDNQYRFPTEGTRRNLSDFARFAAQHYLSPEDPSLEVKSVKIYRVIHGMLTPDQMAEMGPGRQEPTDPWTYAAYYQGELTRTAI